MKQVGIWMDKLEAKGVVFEDGKESGFHIPSEMDFFNPRGGARSKTKWGPQDVVQDSKYLETEKHQMKRYFQKIVDAVQDVDQLALYGPAEASEKFVKELRENHPQLADKVKIKEKADSMTDNQFKAMAKRFFKIDDQL
ncbi:MAG: hypothetical protein RIM83_10270 [Allomuricauda sp.]|jgi:hypothetical protein|uniref:hypothetical protein n=1 Tax=Allomuricauda sp. CP2A TaxID=1848189 RepID=UPI00082F4C6F|nr:hypothetical protein [Muricauda sp. CP2A]